MTGADDGNRACPGSADLVGPALTQVDVEEGLRALGLARGMAVEVHSSLSSFGRVDGGAQTVVSALMAGVGAEGSLVMPAFRFSPRQQLTAEEQARGIISKLRVLDSGLAQRTGMGVIADTFRQRPDVLTGPGLFRVCAWGRDAHQHSKGFQHLLDSDGWALLLGVDIHRLSTMHYAESRVGGLPPGVTDCYAASPELQADYPAEQWWIEVGTTPEDGWGKIQNEAFQRGLIRQGYIGSARCLLFRAARVTALYERALRADPYRLFGVPRPRGPWRVVKPGSS